MSDNLRRKVAIDQLAQAIAWLEAYDTLRDRLSWRRVDVLRLGAVLEERRAFWAKIVREKA